MLLDFADFTQTAKGQLYNTLYTYIKNAVETKAIKKGEKLPSVREAAAQLNVSRTTVENAYTKLCIEGIVESIPQKGYFVIGIPEKSVAELIKITETQSEILYDFSSRRVDEKASDTEVWKKLVRSVLWDSGELISYGDAQGEPGLRNALADYSYKARGIIAATDNIVIGAGVGPLLNILCGLIGRNITVGFENGGFFEAERIFGDYGIKTYIIPSDKNGAVLDGLNTLNPDILFLLPSALSKISPAALSKRRNEFLQWSKEDENRLIIEDDYNGELRYTARSVPAFQGKSPQNTVYIGSFSKLLLPSVRIAYMVLPGFLKERFKNLSRPYNQTCGKIEQLALEKYITSGALEKHLKKLRRLYYSKSQLLCQELQNNLKCYKAVTLFESSLIIELETNLTNTSKELCDIAHKNGIRLIESKKKGCVRMCFAGIDEEKIPDSIKKLDKIFGNL